MRQLQPYRASVISTMAAAAILVFAGLASAQAQSAEPVVDGHTEVQITSASISTAHRYRPAQWLADMLPAEAPSAGNDEFIYDDNMAFLSIFWMTYIPIVVAIFWLIGDWLTRRFRKVHAAFSSFVSTHVQAELRTVRSNGGHNIRG